MDEIEGSILARVPPAALSLLLTRSTIRMYHTDQWRIEKVNPVEDLVIGLEGEGAYEVEGETVHVGAGEAMLLRRGERFYGRNAGVIPYTGIAQHFTLQAYGGDLFAQMSLRRKVRLSRWDVLAPLVREYRQNAPPGSVTLAQHHMFMVLALAFIDDAFLGWRQDRSVALEGSDAIDLAVMKAAAAISTAPLLDGVADQAVRDAPYNRDYFQRMFRERLGRTPRQYQEFCRIERAMVLLESGMRPSQVAAELGFADPYYFSRAFKRQIGVSPRGHLQKIKLAQSGQILGLDEDAQARALEQPPGGGITKSRRDGG